MTTNRQDVNSDNQLNTLANFVSNIKLVCTNKNPLAFEEFQESVSCSQHLCKCTPAFIQFLSSRLFQRISSCKLVLFRITKTIKWIPFISFNLKWIYNVSYCIDVWQIMSLWIQIKVKNWIDITNFPFKTWLLVRLAKVHLLIRGVSYSHLKCITHSCRPN